MKKALKLSLLALALLPALQARAEGGEGCLPDGYRDPKVEIGSAESLLEILVFDPGQSGGNCNLLRAQATRRRASTSTAYSHAISWRPEIAQTMRTRTLYVRASDITAIQGTTPLRMEIYRQTLNTVPSMPESETMEIRVLLVRLPPGQPETAKAQTEVWVIAQNASGQLGYMHTPIDLAGIDQCMRTGQRFAACLELDASPVRLQLRLHSVRGDQTIDLPAARAFEVLMGNIATSSGEETDAFELAHGLKETITH